MGVFRGYPGSDTRNESIPIVKAYKCTKIRPKPMETWNPSPTPPPRNLNPRNYFLGTDLEEDLVT